jgi:hypothetical protein
VSPVRASLFIVVGLVPSLALAQSVSFSATAPATGPILAINNQTDSGPWPLLCADPKKVVVIRATLEADKPVLTVACEAKP